MLRRVGQTISPLLLGTFALLCAPDCANAAAIVPSARYALPAPAARYVLEPAAVDAAAELRADADRPKSLPLRYAVERAAGNARTRPRAEPAGGEWRDLGDGMSLWRVPVHVAGAASLDFTFSHFFLPPGAQLFVTNDDAILGPYSSSDNPRSHRFATPLVHGDRARIEVLVPQAMKPYLDLELESVFAGYRDPLASKSIANPQKGSGTCNIDTICSQGDAWRSEINAVAVLASQGSYCSGQLVNNTAGDRDPLLLTAHHCFSSSSAGDNLVVYWKYENPTCRVVGSSDNGLPVSSGSSIAQTGGASLLATQTNADVTLFRLHALPPAAASPFYMGWDRTEGAFSSGVAVHHPMADAKRISFASGAVTIDDTDYGQDVAPGLNHWRVDHYDQGTTEPGSSGSALLDLNHHVRGVLSGGAADCSTPTGDDFYGRLSSGWVGDGTRATRLSDWLDPKGTAPITLEGVGSCNAPTVSLALSAAVAKVGDKITFSATASGGSGGYSYAFDVDDDGVADSTDPSQSSIPAVYARAFRGNVSVKVTDGSGCSGTASQALIVQAPSIGLASGISLPTPVNLCGSGDGSIDPGQRWRQQVVLQNYGDLASQTGYAIFAQNSAIPGQASLTLETPAIAIPALAPNATATVTLDYAIDASSSCGTGFRIDLLGAADATGFQGTGSPGNFNGLPESPSAIGVVDRVIETTCAPVTTCPAQVSKLHLDPGAYYDPLRPGTGMTQITLPQGNADPLFFGLWFAGDGARLPTWYQVQAPLHGNQVNSPLYQTHQTQPPTWPQKPVSIGAAQITLVDTDKFAFTWNFPGTYGGAVYVPVTSIASKIRIWNNTSESGWGIYDQITQVGGAGAPPLIASLVYLYDGNGVPRWVQGDNPAWVDGATQAVTLRRPACPGCVWLDYKAGQRNVGTMAYDSSSGVAKISTNITFPAPIPGTWIRSQLPLNALYQSQ